MKFFSITIHKNYYDLTLEDKIKIARDNNANWAGATPKGNKTIVLLKQQN